MNKESIYKIIGYNGEYNANIKKAIRKLLKENHPDHNGDRRIFELINEVKDELENNKVSYDYKKNKSNVKIDDDIDYLYCSKMISAITKKKKIYTDELERKKEKLSKCLSEYKDYYRSSINLETYLLSNSQYMDKLKNTKVTCILLLILATIVFLISVWKKDLIIFGIFTLLAILCIITIHKSFFVMQKITENNRKKVKSYVGVNNKIRNNQDDQEKLKKDILELEKKINNLDNDLRFYDNLLNNRG